MLSAIKASLIEAISTSDEMNDKKMDKAMLRWNKIQKYLKTHDYIMNADVGELCGEQSYNKLDFAALVLEKNHEILY